MPRFIVLAGKKQSGKTTSAQHIKKELLGRHRDLSIAITSFATPIKEFCRNVLGLTEAQVYGSDEDKNMPTQYIWDKMPKEIRLKYDPPKAPETCKTCGQFYPLLIDYAHEGKTGPMTSREIMQIFGTDIIRECFDYDVWAKAPFIKDWGYTDFVIIDDCRFPNEADMALQHNATFIKLTRNVLGDDIHESEKALDNYTDALYTYVIDNQNYDDITQLFTDLNNIVHTGII